MDGDCILMEKMPAPNKRFGEIGVKVIIRISVCRLTVSDNPNGVQLRPTRIRDFKMEQQFNSLDRVMEPETISKNGAKPKSHTSREKNC